ncbi:FixH family protein [Salinimicrobium sediminilitoris]|uniref:FixH family protein n=1 Tax=Salinimicrobium sediminilitoris TaxID=2876715 RepID=UPI001E2EC214|nr:FixH family protein [Salinimicrobium sediminilitoris]MCC8361094.1 FixH family protein [Salinimicrobium sediminilitoris]
MKLFKYISLLLVAAVTSCSTDSEDLKPVNETEGLIKIQTIENETHEAELYSESGGLQTGYNKMVLRLMDKSTKEFVQDADIEWNPMMHMETKQHSAPKSEVLKIPGTNTLFEGYIVFQMPENEIEFWRLTLNYSLDGNDYSMGDKISVPASEKRRVAVFLGTDDVKYILALVEPTTPKIATNDISAALFRMENMQSFPVVNNYRILIDPRMPGMDNHSSPNNVPLTQSGAGELYEGKLNLTMSGYWKINLQVENPEGEVMKGEKVEGTNEASSIFFELEF